jgi:hypothetical protein
MMGEYDIHPEELTELRTENERLRAVLIRILSTPFNPGLLAGGTEWMAACTDGRLALAGRNEIPGPSAEQEVEHLAEQCSTLLRENERLRDLQRGLTITEISKIESDVSCGRGLLGAINSVLAVRANGQRA